MILSDPQISHLLSMLNEAIDFDIKVDGEIKEEDGEKYVTATAGSMDIQVEMKIFLPDDTIEK
nr:hypothetical protein [Nitrososphaeria archaeon]